MKDNTNKIYLIDILKNALVNNDSKFYTPYPSSKIGERGKHEWLDVCVALGCFPAKNNQHSTLLTSELFYWNAVDKVMKKRNDLMKVKRAIVCLFFVCLANLTHRKMRIFTHD